MEKAMTCRVKWGAEEELEAVAPDAAVVLAGDTDARNAEADPLVGLVRRGATVADVLRDYVETHLIPDVGSGTMTTTLILEFWGAEDAVRQQFTRPRLTVPAEVSVENGRYAFEKINHTLETGTDRER